MTERRASSYLGWGGEIKLATAIREIHAKHEASWNPQDYKRKSLNLDTDNYDGPVVWEGKYTKSYSVCIHEVVGNDPIASILACLFTAGYAEMWEFCDQVLGPMEDKT